jgi:prefoldin beta subunit
MVDKETEKKISQLQMMEQSMQSFLIQKQQFQAQLIEIESALKELEKSKEAYKIVGNIMISSNKEELKKDLERKKEMVELRIKTLEKQESQIKEKASNVQAEVIKELKEKKKE